MNQRLLVVWHKDCSLFHYSINKCDASNNLFQNIYTNLSRTKFYQIVSRLPIGSLPCKQGGGSESLLCCTEFQKLNRNELKPWILGKSTSYCPHTQEFGYAVKTEVKP